MKGLEALANMEYPGGVIIIGRDISGENNIVVYAMTGRHKPTKARELKFDGQKLLVRAIDENEVKKGNVDVLIYRALAGDLNKGVAVSNGKQTNAIKSLLKTQESPYSVLVKALHKIEYLPDKQYTPRISGCIIPEQGAALSIIKRAEDGSPIRKYFRIPLINGKGKLITAYTGEKGIYYKPFVGEPIDVELKDKTPKETAEAVYAALGPKRGKDLRISAITLFYNEKKGTWWMSSPPINRYKSKGGK